MSSRVRYWKVVLVPEWGIWEPCRDKEVIAIGYFDPNVIDVRRFVDVMDIGDKVVAYLRDWKVGAIGTITGEYRVDEVMVNEDFRRTRKVRWEHKSLDGWDFHNELSDDLKSVLSQKGFTVIELTKEQYEEIQEIILSF